MKKKPLSVYKYKERAESSVIFVGILPYVVVTSLFLLVFYLSLEVHLAFLLLFLVFWFIYKNLSEKNESITVDSNFFIYCGKIIWYQNIEQIVLHKGKQELLIKPLVEEGITINSANFPTNARKDFKISRNKAEKFFKISGKIIKNVKSISPQTQVIIK